MLDMDEVTAALTAPMDESEDSKETAAELADPKLEMAEISSSHADMMCQIIMQMGRLDAKLDMLLEEEDDEEEIADDGILTLPMGSQAGSGGSSSGNITYDGAVPGVGYDGFMP